MKLKWMKKDYHKKRQADKLSQQVIPEIMESMKLKNYETKRWRICNRNKRNLQRNNTSR